MVVVVVVVICLQNICSTHFDAVSTDGDTGAVVDGNAEAERRVLPTILGKIVVVEGHRVRLP